MNLYTFANQCPTSCEKCKLSRLHVRLGGDCIYVCPLTGKQGDIKSAERNYRMKIRDGIPILTNDQKDHHKTKRFIMTLNKPMIIECLRQQQRNCWK